MTKDEREHRHFYTHTHNTVVRKRGGNAHDSYNLATGHSNDHRLLPALSSLRPQEACPLPQVFPGEVTKPSFLKRPTRVTNLIHLNFPLSLTKGFSEFQAGCARLLKHLKLFLGLCFLVVLRVPWLVSTLFRLVPLLTCVHICLSGRVSFG